MTLKEVCRACGRWPREVIGHLLSSCTTYEFHLIKDRHDRVLFQLVKAMAKALNVRMRPCYRANGGVAKNGVYESRLAELVVDCALPTDRETASRRPDVKLRHTQDKRIVIADVACAWDPLVRLKRRLSTCLCVAPLSHALRKRKGFSSLFRRCPPDGQRRVQIAFKGIGTTQNHLGVEGASVGDR
jgi:hypothetical protein